MLYYVDLKFPDGSSSDGTLDVLPEVGKYYEGYKVKEIKEETWEDGAGVIYAIYLEKIGNIDP